MDTKTLIIILAAMVLVAAIAGVNILIKSKRGSAKVGSDKAAHGGANTDRKPTKAELADRERERKHEATLFQEAVKASMKGARIDFKYIHIEPSTTQQSNRGRTRAQIYPFETIDNDNPSPAA